MCAYTYLAYQPHASTVQSAVIITDAYRIDVSLFVVSYIYFGALALIYICVYQCVILASFPIETFICQNLTISQQPMD